MVIKTNKIVEERTRTSARLNFQNDLYEASFKALGTNCSVKYKSTSSKESNNFFSFILNWIVDYESRYSRYLDSSLIGLINSNAGISPVELNKDDERLFTICDEMHFFTRGIFDPTALPLIKLWNWNSKSPVIPNKTSIDIAKKNVNWKNVVRKPGSIFLPDKGMEIDLGGIGKEYAIDQLVQMAVTQHGIKDLMIDFGQDVFALGSPSGKPAWHIGLDDAYSPGSCWAGVAINNHSVASSGDYIRSFVLDGIRYSHIIDIRSGYPVCNGSRSVTVISPSCAMAGILSTTAFILGVEKGLDLIESYYRAEGCVTTDKYRAKTSKFDEYVVS